MIIQRKRVNKIFGKCSTRLLDHFIKFIITIHLRLHRTHANGHHLQHSVAQTECRLLNSTIVKEEDALYVLFFQIVSYILSMMRRHNSAR
jgi:hypothetical protein